MHNFWALSIVLGSLRARHLLGDPARPLFLDSLHAQLRSKQLFIKSILHFLEQTLFFDLVGLCRLNERLMDHVLFLSLGPLFDFVLVFNASLLSCELAVFKSETRDQDLVGFLA